MFDCLLGLFVCRFVRSVWPVPGLRPRHRERVRLWARRGSESFALGTIRKFPDISQKGPFLFFFLTGAVVGMRHVRPCLFGCQSLWLFPRSGWCQEAEPGSVGSTIVDSTALLPTVDFTILLFAKQVGGTRGVHQPYILQWSAQNPIMVLTTWSPTQTLIIMFVVFQVAGCRALKLSRPCSDSLFPV